MYTDSSGNVVSIYYKFSADTNANSSCPFSNVLIKSVKKISCVHVMFQEKANTVTSKFMTTLDPFCCLNGY